MIEKLSEFSKSPKSNYKYWLLPSSNAKDLSSFIINIPQQKFMIKTLILAVLLVCFVSTAILDPLP